MKFNKMNRNLCLLVYQPKIKIFLNSSNRFLLFCVKCFGLTRVCPALSTTAGPVCGG